jgi:hypothetical protein
MAADVTRAHTPTDDDDRGGRDREGSRLDRLPIVAIFCFQIPLANKHIDLRRV